MQFWAYHIIAHYSEENGALKQATDVHIVLDRPDEDEALRQAKALAPGRPYYHTRAIVERWPDLEQAGFDSTQPLVSALRSQSMPVQFTVPPGTVVDELGLSEQIAGQIASAFEQAATRTNVHGIRLLPSGEQE